MEHIPILIIIVPLLAAFLTHLTKYVNLERGAEIVALMSIIFSLAILLLVSPVIMTGDIIKYDLGGWPSRVGISLQLDGLSFFFALLTLTVGLLITIYSLGVYAYVRRYYSLLLIAFAGLLGLVLTRDIFNLYVFFEILAVSSYVLIIYKRQPREVKASFKYLMITESTWVFFLLAIAILYGLTGSLNMDRIAEKIPQIYSQNPAIVYIVFSILLAAFGVKSGMFPLHTWIPEAHSQAPTPVSSLLSGLVLNAGIYSMLRIFYLFFNMKFVVFGIGQILIVLGIITLIFGALLALVQDELKKLLAYSSINQIGFVLVGVGLGTELGLKGGIFHILNHAIIKSALFFCAGIIISQTGFWRISQMKGVFKKMPRITIAFIILAISVIGLPPFNGFASKVLIVRAAINSGYYLITLSLLAGIILSAAYYFRIIRIFLQPEETRERKEFYPSPVGPFEHFAAYVCTFICVCIGIYPAIVDPIINHAVGVLLK